MQVKILTQPGQPVKVIRARKPRKGGATLGVFKNGEMAAQYIARNKHTLAA